MSILSERINAAREHEQAEIELKEQQREEQRQLSIGRKIEAERRRIKRVIENFEDGFGRAVVKKTISWKSVADLKLADAYATALLNQSGSELPVTPKHIMTVLNQIFVYGVVLQGDALPENVFAGQKQEWFAALLEEQLDKMAEPDVNKPERILYTSPPIVSEEDLATPPETPSVAPCATPEVLASAITPTTKKKRARR